MTGWLVLPVLAAAYGSSALVLGGWWGAAAIGALAWPIGTLGRRAADWVVYRGRPDPSEATARMPARLGERTTTESVSAIVLRAAVEAVHLDGAGSPVPGSRRPSWARSTGPSAFQFATAAVLHLPPRRGESGFTERDRRVLTARSSYAAPALHGARTLAELQESRARLVTAREEERRRLRRELHDSLGPALSGLSLSAAALARRIGCSEARELHLDIQDVGVQTRQIAYDLRPPVLDDHGLVAAILDRTAADDGLEVRITAPDMLVLPAAVDLAALRIVTEAVANVRKHAGGQQVCVDIVVQDDRLVRAGPLPDRVGRPDAWGVAG